MFLEQKRSTNIDRCVFMYRVQWTLAGFQTLHFSMYVFLCLCPINFFEFEFWILNFLNVLNFEWYTCKVFDPTAPKYIDHNEWIFELVVLVAQSGRFTIIMTVSPWVAIQASRCAGRVDRLLAVKNPGVSLRPSHKNGGRVVPPGTIVVLLQDITREKGYLLIRYPDLIRTMYWVSLVGI